MSPCGYRGAQEISQKVSDVRKHLSASLTAAKVMLMQVRRKLSTQLFCIFKVGLRRVFVLVAFTAKLRNACLVSATNLLFVIGKWKYFKFIIRIKLSISIPAQ